MLTGNSALPARAREETPTGGVWKQRGTGRVTGTRATEGVVEMDNMQLEGKWQNAKGRIKEAWGSLTDDDLMRAEGNRDQLVGTIRDKTGEKIEDIESRLDDILAQDD
jgi:uncharacterized protein YjbJ (UPF0337 family)